MMKYWIASVSKQHVDRGVLGGFCQVCHGKSSPLGKMKSGDWLVYYSPRQEMDKSSEDLKSFTAICQMVDDNIYPFEMSDDFIPNRRNVKYLESVSITPIRPLLSQLSFTKDRQSHWGAMFRTGLFEITKDDFDLISKQMINNKTLDT